MLEKVTGQALVSLVSLVSVLMIAGGQVLALGDFTEDERSWKERKEGGHLSYDWASPVASLYAKMIEIRLR